MATDLINTQLTDTNDTDFDNYFIDTLITSSPTVFCIKGVFIFGCAAVMSSLGLSWCQVGVLMAVLILVLWQAWQTRVALTGLSAIDPHGLWDIGVKLCGDDELWQGYLTRADMSALPLWLGNLRAVNLHFYITHPQEKRLSVTVLSSQTDMASFKKLTTVAGFGQSVN